MSHPLPTQDELRGNADPLLRVLTQRSVDFRAHHLHEGSDYHDAVTNGQKPLAIVSQCIDGRQPAHAITGLPLGKLITQSSIAGFLRDYPDSPAAWASLLFGIRDLGAPVVIKLGHTGCGGAGRLIELCLNREALPPGDPDPLRKWLQAAVPLAQGIIDGNPGLAKADMIRALEEELVRDGVRKLERFIDRMAGEGHLAESQRPVIVGLLFEMRTAHFYRLLPTGEFKVLSSDVVEQN